MHEIHLVLEWLAVIIDLSAVLIMIWAFVAAVVGLVVIRTAIAYFINKEIQEVSAELAQEANIG